LELEDAIMRERQKQSERTEREQNQRALQSGDLCLVFAPDRLIDDSKGLRTKWHGPFAVLKQVSATVYMVLFNGHPRAFHVQRLLIYDPSGVAEGTVTAQAVILQKKLYQNYMKSTHKRIKN